MSDLNEKIIDVESLLQPIGENGVGESLAYSGIYDEIREARRQDDNLAQGTWQRELKTADWNKVIELAANALQTQTKDLQIAAWLAEALTKKHGFRGLRDALELLKGLHERFWETIFPEIDEGGDLEARANAVEFADKQTAFAVKEVPLTEGERLNFLQLVESRQFDIPENLDALDYEEQQKFAELKAEAEATRKTTGEAWRRAKNATRRAFAEETFQLLEQCRTQTDALEQLVDEKFGRQTPGVSNLRKSLEDVSDALKKIVLEKRELEPDANDVSAESTSENSSESLTNTDVSASRTTNGNFVANAQTTIRSRQDALRSLAQVAEFLRQTEPHSPVSYLVGRAVKLGAMPLEEVLKELIKDESVLSNLRETLGISES